MDSSSLVHSRMQAALYCERPLLAPFEAEPVPVSRADDEAQRKALLINCFYELSREGGPTDPDVLDCISEGLNLRLVIGELALLEEPTEAENILAEKRCDVVETLRQGVSVRHRDPEAEEHQENTYVNQVLGKVEAHIDARTVDESLVLLQIPKLLERASFDEDTVLTKEEFASNHLAVLMDILLKEHVKLREDAFGNRESGRIERLVASRAMRLAVAGGIFAAALIPKLNIIPTPEENISHDIEFGLKMLTGTILGIEAPKLIGERVTKARNTRIRRQRQETFSADKELCDTALMVAYNSTRYGSDKPGRRVTGRSATDDPATNLERLKALDIEFQHLNNDPGGKPYNAEQALAFVSHVTVDFKDYVDGILENNGDPDLQKKLFMELSEVLIRKDIFYLRHRIRTGRFRKIARGGAAVIPMLMFPSATLAAAEARTITGDTMHNLPDGKHNHDDNDD